LTLLGAKRKIMSSAFSRRGFLKGLGIGVGAAIGTRIAGGAQLIGEAKAAAVEPNTSVLILHLVGGYNALFGSANSLVGRFGVTAGNHTVVGNGLGIDNVFANSMSNFVKQHIASVGVRHNISNHPGARQALWTHNNQNAALSLANAIGGTASIKAAVVGGNLIAEAPRTAVGGVSFQSITDMQKTIDALGGGAPNPRVPDRGIALTGVQAAQTMSGNALAGSPESLLSMSTGYTAAVDTLKQPIKTFDFEELKTAYKLGAGTAVNNFKAKMAAAELMVRAGSNVVAAFDGGWDTHGDTNGTTVRNKMTALMEPLNMFLTRMVQDAARNVSVVIIGDFARSLPGSDHQPNLTATVIGKNVKQGTTGRTATGTVGLSPATPNIPGLWSLVGAITKLDASPFGANQHAALMV